MWSATIKQKGIQDKAFLVNVLYTNGTIAFNEIMDMTGGTLDIFSQKVDSRLATLNATETLIPQVTIGPYVSTAPAPSSLQAFLLKLHTFQNAQMAVTLGFMTTADVAYTTALTDAQAAFDPAFLGQF